MNVVNVAPKSVQGTAESLQRTAETIQGSGPSLTLGESTKIAYAPGVKEAKDFLKSRGYEISAKTDDEGNYIVNEVSDLYLLPPNAPEDITNDYLDRLATRVTPGFFGTVIHELPVAAASIGGGIAGASVGNIGGAMLGAGLGGGGAEALNQMIGAGLYDKKFDPNLKDIAITAGTSALFEGAGRGLAPVIKGIMPKTSNAVGEAAINRIKTPDLVPINGQQVNIQKLMKGSKSQTRAELEKVNSTVKKEFQKVRDDLDRNPTPLEDEANSLELKKLWDDLNKESDNTYGELSPENQEAIKLAETLVDEIKSMRGNENLTNEQLIGKMRDPEFYKNIVNIVERRFLPREMGMSYEDILKKNPRELNFLSELTAKRARAGLIPEETSNSLQRLTRQIGDLAGEMAMEKRLYPNILPTSPMNFKSRGAELLGQGLTHGGIRLFAKPIANSIQAGNVERLLELLGNNDVNRYPNPNRKEKAEK